MFENDSFDSLGKSISSTTAHVSRTWTEALRFFIWTWKQKEFKQLQYNKWDSTAS